MTRNHEAIRRFSHVVHIFTCIALWSLLAVTALVATAYAAQTALGAAWSEGWRIGPARITFPTFDFAGSGLGFTVNGHSPITFAAVLVALAFAAKLSGSLARTGDLSGPGVSKAVWCLGIALAVAGVLGNPTAFLGAALAIGFALVACGPCQAAQPAQPAQNRDYTVLR